MKIKRYSISLSMAAIVLSSCSHGSSVENKGMDASQSAQVTNTPASADPGKVLYAKYCLACHQSDGSGVPGMYPPLKNSSVINSGNKEKIMNILLNGLKGPIEVNGQKYNQQMPSQAFLTNEQIAEIINYVSKSFGNKGPSLKAAEIDSVRKKLP